MADASYIHGTTPDEQRRLSALNRLTNASFVAWLDPTPGEQILEIGSGLGILAQEVRRRLQVGHVTGLEFAAEQLACAPVEPGLSFVQGDAHQLPWSDARFDLVYCRYLLEHVSRPQQVVHEAYRVLRPGGRFCVQENDILISVLDPACPLFEELWQRFAALQASLGGDARIGRRLFALLRRAGFVNLRLSLEPEVHWSGSPDFSAWIDNLRDNLSGASERLVAAQLASEAQLDAANAELEQFKHCPEASAWFYWNRAEGQKLA